MPFHPFVYGPARNIVRAVRYDPAVHHRRSIRLPTWDYSESGAYFVTICTHDRECILDDAANLAILEDVWRRVIGSGHGLGEFVAMPKHVHGIVWIAEPDAVGAPSGSLGQIVGSFKSATAKRINNRANTPGEPVWQRNYHEHIIRDEDDLNRVRQYILDSPRKWGEDPNNPTVFMNHVGENRPTVGAEQLRRYSATTR